MQASYLRVKNHTKHQHYDPTKRRPPWIKLYNDLLGGDVGGFDELSEAEQWQLVRIWLVASKSSALTHDENGKVVPVVANDEKSLRRSIMSLKRIPLEKFIREGWLIPVAEDELIEADGLPQPTKSAASKPVRSGDATDAPWGFDPEWRRLRQEVLERDDYTCHYCHRRRKDERVYAGPGKTRSAMTVDHVIPRAKGGDDSPENLVACCVDCNLAKGDGDASVVLAKTAENDSTALALPIGPEVQRVRSSETSSSTALSAGLMTIEEGMKRLIIATGVRSREDIDKITRTVVANKCGPGAIKLAIAAATGPGVRDPLAVALSELKKRRAA